MISFIALYRGASVNTAQIIAVSADPDLVLEVADKLLKLTPQPSDPILGARHDGERKALRLVLRELEANRVEGSPDDY